MCNFDRNDLSEIRQAGRCARHARKIYKCRGMSDVIVATDSERAVPKVRKLCILQQR